MSVTVRIPRKLETCIEMNDKKKVPSIQKGQRIHDKCGKAVANLPKSFGNNAVAFSCSEYDINKKEDFNSFKTEQTHIVSSLEKSL
jgi:hypothetical protein